MAAGDGSGWLMREEARSVIGGVIVMLVAGLMSSLLHIGVRYVSPHIPAIETVFLRTIFTLLFTAPVLWASLASARASWKSNNLKLQIARGIVGVGSMSTWYWALGNMPLADAGVLSFTTGLFVTVGAALWFREPVGVWRWSAVLVGLAGAILVLRPGQGVTSWPAVAAVGSSALWAISLLMAKELSRYDSVLTVAFYQPLMIIPFAGLATIPVWTTPSLGVLLVLVLMGAVAAIANYCYVRSFKLADASVVMIADYVRLVWMVWWGSLLFGEWPDLTTWIGAILIIGATFFITVRESRMKPKPRDSDAAPAG